MSGYRRFNAQEMLEYLAEVDEELVLAGADSVRLVAVGGAAMATRRASRMTGDIECRLHFGPGYRIYLGRDGGALIILLVGGTKARQQQDIEKARELWRDYRRRKRQEV